MIRKPQKIVFLILVLCIMVGITQLALASAGTFQTTTDGVRVRSEPSSEGSVVALVNTGTNVEVLEYNPGGWSKVQVGNITGYIWSEFLKANTGNEAANAFRTTAGVNLRSEASTESSILRTLATGTSVEVLENRADGWSRVRVSNTEGFLRTNLLTNEAIGAGAGSRDTLRTKSTVNLRAGPSTSNSILRTLSENSRVEVLEQTNGWSRVRVNDITGFVRSDLLTDAAASSSTVIATLRTITGVNLRSGPSTSNSVIRLLPVNTSVEVLENQTNGWSRVRVSGVDGFIRSDLLGSGPSAVELIDWSSAKTIVPTGVNLRVVDVRTGITFNLRGIAKSSHMDVEPPTQADTDAILRTRNGVWAWTPRPVWVTVGDRTFAAAINGMPHDVSTIRDNGMNGHLCMHFGNTETNSQSYQRELRNAVTEAYDARPR